MEYSKNLLNVEEECLVEELPERHTIAKSTSISLCDDEYIDDSGFEISDSLEILKKNIENRMMEDWNCEIIDEEKSSCNMLPELIPLQDLTQISFEQSPHKNQESPLLIQQLERDSCKDNLPKLQPIPNLMLKGNEILNSNENTNANLQNESRRSSTSSFIDSLIAKFRRNNSESSGSEISPTKLLQESKSSDEDMIVELNKSVSYLKSSVPNMLPTPIVENQSISSVFVNSVKEYEEVLERNKQRCFREQDDKSKMSSKSQPPRMKAPILPSNIQHPRTLAQKRLLLSNNLNFLMIEQESKIFKQIQRKINGRDLNFQLIDDLCEEDIPLKHGPWKALSWLKTEEGNYIQQYINIDGQNYKLNGSKGNHKNKFLPSQSCKPFPKRQTLSLRSIRCCEGGKVKKRIIDSLINIESIRKFILEENLSPYKKLELRPICNYLSSIKPRPFGKKIEYLNKTRKFQENDEDDIFLSDYIKFKMPNIKLEVKPQKKIPLDVKAKQYLNEIIPYKDLNENWINFSLSTISSKEEENKQINEIFAFNIPYCDGKQHILAREILKPANVSRYVDKHSNFDTKMKWTFVENCDKNDPLEMEIADIIKDLSTSTWINLNDDLFTMDEPYEVSSTTVAPIKAKEAINKIASTSKNLKIDQSKKMLLELRRLNANVVKSDFSRVEDEEDIRRHALAHLAKDERELRPTVIVTHSDTVLLSNKKTETRRQKRAPKRYSDYSVDDTEKEEEFEPPKKFKPKELIDEPFKTKAQHKDTGAIQEELKMLKEEVIKWIHVNVKLTKIEYLDELQPWCMIHNLYKCSCKAMIEPVITKKTDEIMETKSLNTKNNEGSKKEIFVETFQTIENNLGDVSIKDDLIDDCSIKFEEKVPNIAEENSRRVLPIDIEKSQKNVCEIAENIDLEDENKENAPKMEILNLSELVNGGIGPIYINVYDTKVNRLNPIFRSILNNRTALVYLDGLGYHLNMRKIDVMKLKFDKIKEELEHPVFIICPKNFNSLDDTAKIYDDFINLLFKDDSELIIQIRNKFVLKEVARIIEIVLQSVRKKIEIQIGSNPSDYVKEQLSLITRDRSNSNTSVSSADTSPLHFNGKMLEKAPSPGLNTEIMREFNKIFSMRMQRFCAIIRSNTLGLHPLDGYVNKFYIYKWSLLIKSFEEGLINIWQVRIKKETDNYFVYVITKTATPPIVNYVDHESIVNVKILPLSNTSIVIRMILLRVENSKTKNMTVLLFGCKGYFRICGLLNSKESYFEGVSSKPLKQTHPRLTAKIQKVYNIWYGLKKATSQNNNLTDSKNEHLVKEIETNDESSINVTASSNKIDNNIKQLSSKYKWFLFNISNDFSDIYIKQWKNYLSYKIIMEAIKRAKIKQQTIRILGPLNSAKDTPRIFALPRSPLNFKKGENLKMTENFLIFGPYLRNSNSNLLLMQNVDGKMFLRDDYEKRSNIQRESRTRCLWIYANSLKCVAETCIENIQPDWNRSCVNKL